jgi:hypothetical protein
MCEVFPSIFTCPKLAMKMPASFDIVFHWALRRILCLIEVSERTSWLVTGPLGQGICNAIGLAAAEAHLAARFNKPDAPPIVDHYT